MVEAEGPYDVWGRSFGLVCRMGVTDVVEEFVFDSILDDVAVYFSDIIEYGERAGISACGCLEWLVEDHHSTCVDLGDWLVIDEH